MIPIVSEAEAKATYDALENITEWYDGFSDYWDSELKKRKSSRNNEKLFWWIGMFADCLIADASWPGHIATRLHVDISTFHRLENFVLMVTDTLRSANHKLKYAPAFNHIVNLWDAADIELLELDYAIEDATKRDANHAAETTDDAGNAIATTAADAAPRPSGNEAAQAALQPGSADGNAGAKPLDSVDDYNDPSRVITRWQGNAAASLSLRKAGIEFHKMLWSDGGSLAQFRQDTYRLEGLIKRYRPDRDSKSLLSMLRAVELWNYEIAGCAPTPYAMGPVLKEATCLLNNVRDDILRGLYGLNPASPASAAGAKPAENNKPDPGGSQTAQQSAAPKAADAASPVEKPKWSSSEDFTDVDWYGTRYIFDDGLQAKAIGCLLAEFEKGEHALSEKTIGEKIGSDNDNFRLSQTFRVNVKGSEKKRRKTKMHAAWGKMIQKVGTGLYRLVKPEIPK